jgi:hypothetical protein
MTRHPTPRSPSWQPGAALLAAALIVGIGTPWALGARVWWAYLGGFLAVLLCMGQVERLLTRRGQPRPPRGRGRLKVITGGKAGYDLEKDDPETKQRWLM